MHYHQQIHSSTFLKLSLHLPQIISGGIVSLMVLSGISFMMSSFTVSNLSYTIITTVYSPRIQSRYHLLTSTLVCWLIQCITLIMMPAKRKYPANLFLWISLSSWGVRWISYHISPYIVSCFWLLILSILTGERCCIILFDCGRRQYRASMHRTKSCRTSWWRQCWRLQWLGSAMYPPRWATLFHFANLLCIEGNFHFHGWQAPSSFTSLWRLTFGGWHWQSIYSRYDAEDDDPSIISDRKGFN